MADEKKTLDATKAGWEINPDIIEQMEIYERRLQENREKMEKEVAQKEKALTNHNNEQGDVQAKLDPAEQGRKDMPIGMEELEKKKERQHHIYRDNLDNKIKEREGCTEKGQGI